MADALTITAREGLGVASVMARKEVAAEAIGAALGLDMPRGPATTSADGITVLGTGPGAWLVLADHAGPDFADDLARTLVGLASVSDQSSGYIVHRLAGDGARALLQRGVAIDLHPDVFRAGMAATTVVAHVGVIVWQVDDRPTYDVAVLRSFAGSFRHWLDQTGAAFERV